MILPHRETGKVLPKQLDRLVYKAIFGIYVLRSASTEMDFNDQFD